MPSALLTKHSRGYVAGATHALTLQHLQNSLLPGYVTTATVTATITDKATGTPISGQTWPITLDYVAGSNGNYRGTLEDDLVVVIGQTIRITIVVDAGSGVKRTFYYDTVIQE